MHASPEYQQWFDHLSGLVGGETSVHAYRDDSEENSINIFRSVNAEGSLFATIGLMEIDQSKNPALRVASEVLMDCRGNDENVGNILSTIAFFIMKNGWRIAPRVVFEDLVAMYFPGHHLPHVMFVSPFQWRTEMTKVEVVGKFIYPLVAIPISEAERTFSASHPDRALEHLWESKHIDVLNWARPSAA